MYSNIRGLRGKKASLTEVLHEKNPQIFLITETQLRSNTGTNIDGYTFYGRPRGNQPGGGVGILVRNDIRNNVAPHINDRNLEIMWVSIRRKNFPPLFIGTYYGKQESRTSKEEIEKEMTSLTQEIEETKSNGVILLAMDANAKIGLLGENESRNGKLMKKVFEETELFIMNEDNKCEGKITRKNTSNENEISAIDLVLTSKDVKEWIQKMIIDEDGLIKIKGKKESDHNTIVIDLAIPNVDKITKQTKTNWNLRASTEKWKQFENELERRREKANKIIADESKPFNERYKAWYKELEAAARTTIGKTTNKEGKKEKFSGIVENMRSEKKELKTKIKNAQKQSSRTSSAEEGPQPQTCEKSRLINEYKLMQEKLKNQIIKEKAAKIQQRFNKIIADKSRNAFWKEKKFISRNNILESLIVKNEDKNRLFEPDSIKEYIAYYYEQLYKQNPITPRKYHDEIKKKMKEFENDATHEDLPCNIPPTERQILEIIETKKNGKSTTDFKNEMVKRPDEKMSRLIQTLIKTVWKEEQIPDKWNKGEITSLWKGKGDRELLTNHRGITVSSSFGTILEEHIDKQIEKTVPYTQAQGEGKRGASTCDHLFILRAMIDIALRQKRPTYITFFDVSKAYDNVDVEDMLVTMWEKGLKGKIWRILKNMSQNQKASIKTRFGSTREINMEIGGKQGSRLTGRMFSKMMDLLSEEVEESDEGFRIAIDLVIGVLLWVDDVVTCVDGIENQEKMLQRVSDFAKDHKLKWGQEKCKVLKIEKPTSSNQNQPHTNITNQHQNEWDLGEIKIETAKSYTYLGDLITCDGKNTENLNTRKTKLNASTIAINTIAANEVLYQIESTVLLELHEKVNISSLLTNSESWNLLKGEETDLDKLEITCLKNMFDLPIKTPTPAIIFTLGTLYTSIRVDQKQLLYLHKILTKDETNWMKRTLMSLKDLKLGWYTRIKDKLLQYKLNDNFEQIKSITYANWKHQVKAAIEKRNKEKLLNECYKTENGMTIPKTKTSAIVKQIEKSDYKRSTCPLISKLTKNESKLLLIAKFGMLECGKNYKGTIKENCTTCNVYDDEEHRLNHCIKYRELNYHDADEKTPFKTIFSNDISEVKNIFPMIEQVWNVKLGHGSMK